MCRPLRLTDGAPLSLLEEEPFGGCCSVGDPRRTSQRWAVWLEAFGLGLVSEVMGGQQLALGGYRE
jgi:hypothetical protein